MENQNTKGTKKSSSSSKRSNKSRGRPSPFFGSVLAFKDVLFGRFIKKSTNKYSAPYNQRLVDAISRQRTETIAQILEERTSALTTADLDAALILSASLGQTSVCKLLLDAGADPDARENPEEQATRNKKIPPAFSSKQAHKNAWLSRNATVGGTALHRAAENNQLDTARLLLDQGSKVNARDRHGVTPLMVACMCNGGQEVACLLLNTPGCDINLTDKKNGRTALHYAAEAGNPTSVKLLLSEEADVDAQDLNSNTALLLCCKTCKAETDNQPNPRLRNSLACISLLLNSSCFVNLFNQDSETALHCAVEGHSNEAVLLLLESGAVVHPEIVRDACLVYRDEEVLQLLLEHDRSLHDDFLLFLLIALIVTKPSLWMLNNAGEENRLHLASKYLLKRINNVNSLNNLVFQMTYTDMENLFGEDFAESFKESVKEDLEAYGVFGLALRYGKYSVAKMLWLAGSDVSSMQIIRETEWCQALQRSPYLKPWLPNVLQEPLSLKTLSQRKCRALGLSGERLHQEFPAKLRDCLDLKDLDKVEAFDVTVQEVGELLMDTCYSGREMSKAARQQILWIYL